MSQTPGDNPHSEGENEPEDGSGMPGFGFPGAGFPGFPGGGFPPGGMPTGPQDMSRLLDDMIAQSKANPELAELMKSMGVDLEDPALRQQLDENMRAFMGAAQSNAPAVEVATAAAHKVLAEGRPSSAADTDGEAAIDDKPARPDVVTDADRRDVEDAVGVAQLWLSPVTQLDEPAWSARALTRAEWVDATMPEWARLVEPISEGVTAAMTKAVSGQLEQFGSDGSDGLDGLHIPGMDQLPEALRNINPAELMGQVAPMMRNVSRQLFATQLGAGVGTLADSIVSATEVGLPLTPSGQVGLLPTAVAQLAEDLQIDEAQVRIYVAVREAARARLFAAAPWLGPQLIAAVSDYARNISIDTEAIESAVRQIDPGDPEAMNAALAGNLFATSTTPAQRAALDRLETLLALAEGWVDHITERATANHLPSYLALGEAIRRRRVGGAAERTFAQLVGLELRPRRLRDAANLWAALEDRGGAELRDARWAHPDLAPTSADLDDPLGGVERAAGDNQDTGNLDAVLADILGGADSAPGPGGSRGSDDSAAPHTKDTAADAAKDTAKDTDDQP